MHYSQGGGGQISEPADSRPGAGGKAAGPEDVLCLAGGLDDVVRGDGRAVAELGEQVTTEERVGGLVEQDAGLQAGLGFVSFRGGGAG